MSTNYSKADRTRIRMEIAQLLSDGRERTTSEIGDRVGVTSQQAGLRLKDLEALGLATREHIMHNNYGWKAKREKV